MEASFTNWVKWLVSKTANSNNIVSHLMLSVRQIYTRELVRKPKGNKQSQNKIINLIKE